MCRPGMGRFQEIPRSLNPFASPEKNLKLSTRPRIPANKLFSYVQIWELLAKVGHLGKIVNHNIRLIRVLGGVVLMVIFCGIERRQGGDLGHNWNGEHPGLVELIDV